ncbi:MAG TPA: HAD family hydrolase [Planctomycetes bacterium]|nr:HAD family hydrolase [Fuerstiella sp.]HIK94389.1 HAD family hydrolase [Planctomycetota bacterium]
MPLTLSEYADSLAERDLIWPQVPAPKPVKAKPAIAPLPGIRVVMWDVYGTLLRTTDGGFTLFPNPEVRLQVALEKTILEFNMWNSMYRKPGPPWQSMMPQYRDYVERVAMVPTKLKCDFTDVNLVSVWKAVIDRLCDKDYKYEQGVYGNEDQLSEKVAYFFHCNLQAMEARAGAVRAMTDLAEVGIMQGILADGQSFTFVQLVRALTKQGLVMPIREIIRTEATLFSHQMAIRKPSESLFQRAVEQLKAIGVSPEQTLHVSCRLATDLVPAKAAGMKTALLVSEKTGLEAPPELIKDPQTRPDRLLTDITQITSVVQPE